MTALADPMLAPHAARIRQLRESRGWSIDDAAATARLRHLRLSRQTLIDLETGDGGCRLATIGYLGQLYGLPRAEWLTELTREVPDRPRRA